MLDLVAVTQRLLQPLEKLGQVPFREEDNAMIKRRGGSE
jgi:hypothetical protein